MNTTNELNVDLAIKHLYADIDDLSRFRELENLIYRLSPHIDVKWLNNDLIWFSVSAIYPPTKRGYARVHSTCRKLNRVVMALLSDLYGS